MLKLITSEILLKSFEIVTLGEVYIVRAFDVYGCRPFFHAPTNHTHKKKLYMDVWDTLEFCLICEFCGVLMVFLAVFMQRKLNVRPTRFEDNSLIVVFKK